MNLQTCARTWDKPCALTVTELHVLHLRE